MAKPVTIRILGDASGLTGTLDRASSKLGSFGAAAGVAAGAAAAAVGAFGVSSVKKFSEFETGMAEVFTLMPGMSEEAMSAMEDQVLGLSNQMGILPQDAIPALYDAISAGVPTDNVFQFMEDASKLAIGGSIDAGEAVDVLSTSVNAWSESNLSAADASDFLFTTVKLGKTTMAELNSSLAQVAPIASAIGVGLDEVGASVAVLTANGMSTSQAATGLKAALSELGKEGTKASDAFKELNDGATFTEFLEAGGTLEEAMVMIADSGESVIDMFGSVEAGGAVLSLTAGDAEQLSANMAVMADSSGAAGEAFEMMDGTTGRSMDRIKAKLQVVQVQIGQKLMPVVERLVDYGVQQFPVWRKAVGDAIAFISDNVLPRIVSAFDAVKGTVTNLYEQVMPYLVTAFDTVKNAAVRVYDWVSSNWGAIMDVLRAAMDKVKDAGAFLVEAFDNVVAAMVAAVEWIKENDPVLAALAAVVGTVVVGAVVSWTVATWAQVTALYAQAAAFVAANAPLIAAAAALAALAAGVVWAYQNVEIFRKVVDKMKDAVMVAFEWLRDNVPPIFEAIVGAIVSAFEWIKERVQDFIDVFQRFWSAWGDTITESLTNAWDAIKGIVSGALDYLKGVFDFWKSLFTGDWQGMWDAIVEVLSGIWTTIKATFLLGWEGVKLSFRMVWSGIENMATGAFGRIVDGIKALPELLYNGVKEGLQFLVDAGAWIGDKIMEGLVSALEFVGQKVWDMLPGPVQWGLEHGFGAIGWAVGQIPGVGGDGGQAETENVYQTPVYNFDNDHMRSGVGMGGTGGTTNINVFTSTNAEPSDITNSVVWGMQVAGVPT